MAVALSLLALAGRGVEWVCRAITEATSAMRANGVIEDFPVALGWVWGYGVLIGAVAQRTLRMGIGLPVTCATTACVNGAPATSSTWPTGSRSVFLTTRPAPTSSPWRRWNSTG